MNDDDLKKIGKLISDSASASEERLTKLVANSISVSEVRLTKLISDSEERIIREIGGFINNTIIPQLDEKADKVDLQSLASKSDIDRLERKLDRVFAKDAEQDYRLDRLESIPVIASELRLKKKK